MAFVEGRRTTSHEISGVEEPTRDRRGTGIDRTSVHSPARHSTASVRHSYDSMRERELSRARPAARADPTLMAGRLHAVELGDVAMAGDQKIRRATEHASPVVRALVRQTSVRSPGRGRLDVFHDQLGAARCLSDLRRIRNGPPPQTATPPAPTSVASVQRRLPHAHVSISPASQSANGTAPWVKQRGVTKTILKSKWSDPVEKTKKAIMNAVFCR